MFILNFDIMAMHKIQRAAKYIQYELLSHLWELETLRYCSSLQLLALKRFSDIRNLRFIREV